MVAVLAPQESSFLGLVSVLAPVIATGNTAVVVAGLAATQAADLDQTSVGVLLSGPVPTLASLPPEQVVASIDVTGRAPGTYTIDVAVRVPSGVNVQTVQPARVTVTIRPK